jgi:flagellin
MSRINTNVPALAAITRLSTNQDDLTLRLERLSSGLRINRGADDPAGLIASESLRSEIRGINAAINNSSRAINVISTADAALSEVSKMLLEVKGLVNASTNSGALSDDEVKANQLQIDSLLESINRVANSTQFNGKKLLNGGLGYTVSSQNAANIPRLQVFGARVPANATLPVTLQVTQSAQTALINITAGGSSGLRTSGFTSVLSTSNGVTLEVRGRSGTELFTFTAGTTVSSIATSITSFKGLTGISATLTKTVGGSATGISFSSVNYGSDEFVSVRDISGAFNVTPGDQGDYEDRGRDAGVLINGQNAAVSGLVASIRSSGLDLVADLSTTFGTTLGTTTFGVTGGGANFQIGSNVNSDGLVSIGIPSINTSNLGSAIAGYLSTIGSGGANTITDSNNHATAADIVGAAITQVAVLSGRLGGFQANQLETNLNSQRVALENVTASESSIRDADYASEVASLTKAQILVQSTTQILSLANQLPQNVLSLLR